MSFDAAGGMEGVNALPHKAPPPLLLPHLHQSGADAIVRFIRRALDLEDDFQALEGADDGPTDSARDAAGDEGGGERLLDVVGDGVEGGTFRRRGLGGAS